MTFEKASKLSAGCEVFENSSGRKIEVISVHQVRSQNQEIVEIAGVIEENQNQFYHVWNHNEVT